MFTDEVRITELEHRTKELMQKKHSNKPMNGNFKRQFKCSNVLEIWISEEYDRDKAIIRDDIKHPFQA